MGWGELEEAVNQPSLFDTLVAQSSVARWERKDVCSKRHGGNPESEAAHEQVKSGKADMWQRILDWGRKQPQGFTASEATAAFGGNPNHVAPRISELLAQGRLVRTGEKRKTRSQCNAAVLKVRV